MTHFSNQLGESRCASAAEFLGYNCTAYGMSKTMAQVLRLDPLGRFDYLPDNLLLASPALASLHGIGD
jgi:hypothetical protein